MIGNRTSRLAIAIVIGAGVLYAITASAQPATEPAEPATQPARPSKPARDEGWISGIALTDEGKPLAAFEIRAERTEPMALGGGGPAPKRPKEVKTTTDDEGKFLFIDLEPNKQYILVAGSAEMGWIYQPVEVKPGVEVKLGEIKLIKL